MHRPWEPLSLSPGDSVRAAVRTIDAGRLGLALVVDASGCLVGTVTDGDVRRAILREVSLDAPVAEVMQKSFVSLEEGATAGAALGLMEERKIRQVPIVSMQRRPLGVFFLPDLITATAKPNWVVLMVGGKGERLGALTENVPKPMLPVGGRPLLEASVRRLVDAGFRSLFLALNYKGEQIEEHFGDGSRFGCEIEYLREKKPLGTGGALGLLKSAPEAPLLVVNGDVMTDVDFGALLDYHVQHGGAATMCVRELVQEVPFGVVRCEGDAVVRLEEKPRQRLLINAGIYVLEPGVVGRVSAGEPCELPEVISAALGTGDPVFAFLVHEEWVDIGQPHDYERVRGRQA